MLYYVYVYTIYTICYVHHLYYVHTIYTVPTNCTINILCILYNNAHYITTELTISYKLFTWNMDSHQYFRVCPEGVAGHLSRC